MCNKPLFWLVDLYMNLPEYNKQVSFCCKYLSLCPALISSPQYCSSLLLLFGASCISLKDYSRIHLSIVPKDNGILL